MASFYILSSELRREELQTLFLMKPIVQAEKDRETIRKRLQLLRAVKERGINVDLQFYHNSRYEDSSIPLF